MWGPRPAGDSHAHSRPRTPGFSGFTTSFEHDSFNVSSFQTVRLLAAGCCSDVDRLRRGNCKHLFPTLCYFQSATEGVCIAQESANAANQGSPPPPQLVVNFYSTSRYFLGFCYYKQHYSEHLCTYIYSFIFVSLKNLPEMELLD